MGGAVGGAEGEAAVTHVGAHVLRVRVAADPAGAARAGGRREGGKGRGEGKGEEVLVFISTSYEAAKIYGKFT